MSELEQRQSRSDPLRGVRVLDFSAMMAGPYCTRILADLGAEVIKIEEPAGDNLRTRLPMRDGCSAYFGHLNSGKRSVVLNLKLPEAVEIARRLVATADVVVEAFRPGVMNRFGFDYAALSADHPRLIYCSISGYGQVGPGALRPAYAPIVHAASGYELANMVYQGTDRPGNSGVFFADVMCGIHAASAIQSALFHREREGRGQFVDVSLMDTMFNSLIYECQEAQFPVEKPRLLYGALRAIDGFVLITPITQRNFEAMADGMGHSEWKTDVRFATPRGREQNWSELMSLAESWTQTRSAQSCEETMLSAGCPCTRYKSVRDALTDPQSVARGSFATVEDRAGAYLVPNLPYSFATARVEVRRHVPELGEHSQQVFEEILGMAAADATALRRRLEK